jgi:hypothetical protein
MRDHVAIVGSIAKRQLLKVIVSDFVGVSVDGLLRLDGPMLVSGYLVLPLTPAPNVRS